LLNEVLNIVVAMYVHYLCTAKKKVFNRTAKFKVKIMARTSTKTAKTLKNLVETQKNQTTKAVKVAKELTKELPLVSETLDKGHDFYNQMADNSVKMIEELTEQTQHTQQQIQQNMEQAQNFFQTWFTNQMEMAKTMFNNNSNTNTNDWASYWNNNPMATWMKNNGMNMDWNNMANITNLFNTMNTMMGGNNPMATWMKNNGMSMDFTNMMNNMNNMMGNNPFASMMNNNAMYTQMLDQMKNGMGNWSNFTQQYMDTVNGMYGDWSKQFANYTTADSFKGMFNMTESLSSFFKLMEPFMASINNKTFNIEDFMSTMQATDLKTFMDKFFNFMPEQMRTMYTTQNAQFIAQMKQMAEQGMNAYNFMSKHAHSNPMMANNPYTNMMDMYTQFKNTATDTISPLANLMQDNSTMQNVQIWNQIADKLTVFNIKNAELQAMMYKQGVTVMEEVGKTIYTKMQNGESFDSIVKVYQEWMMKSDKHFTALFETDEYSALMTEVASLQMKLRQSINEQMEKMFMSNLPIATRTEMDEVYKAIYDLKQEVRGTKRPTPTSAKVTPTAKVAKPAAKATKPAAKKTTKRK
jgi:polyhydroxyalkanoate synthase subunit PhaE